MEYISKVNKFHIQQVVKDKEGSSYTVRAIAEYQFSETEYQLELISDEEESRRYFWEVESNLQPF